jgi:membrane associated rhomboid family serine protease
MIGDVILFGIIILTGFVSYVCFQNKTIFRKLEFSPYLVHQRKEVFRFISYGFVHADWAHLLINMFVLYSFGSSVLFFSDFLFLHSELFFMGLYFGALVMSTLFSYFKHKNNWNYSAVGASGAVSAVVFASILFFPTGSIRLFLIPFDIPAYIFGILYLIYSAVMAKKANDNIGHDAHFFGAVFGIAFPLLFEPRLILHFFNMVF